MAFGAKGKGKPRNPNQQNALFKRKNSAASQLIMLNRSTTKISTHFVTSSKKTARLCLHV